MPSRTHLAVRVAGLLALLAARSPLLAQSGILQIFVKDGENGVFAASGRSTRPFAVCVTSETGAPVPGIAVSFRLAEEGVSGEFSNGLRTELVLTGADGRAVCPAISWGAFAGPGRLRVTAAQGEARAGVLVPYHLSADPSLASPPTGQVVVAGSAVAPQVQPLRIRESGGPTPKVKKKRRWVRWVTSIAAGVGGGLALGLVRRGGGGSRVTEAVGPGVSLGVYTINVVGLR